MVKILRSGIIAGLAGIPFMLISIALFLYYLRNEPAGSRAEMNTLLVFLFVSSFALAFLIAGVLSGLLAFQYIKSAWGAFLPGLVAGLTAGALPLITFFIVIGTEILSGLSGSITRGFWGNIINMLSWTLLMFVGVGMASLCSALTASFIFFRREFYRAGPLPKNETDLEGLSTLYDDLWKDARTMIADMYRSIAIYRIAGLFIVVSGIVLLAFAISGWLKVLGGWYGFYDFIFTVAATMSGLAQLVMGPYLLYWYDKLRKRYMNLVRMEKAAGD